MKEWNEKLPALVKAPDARKHHQHIGCAFWFMTAHERTSPEAGADTIHDVWPTLEVFFHGGNIF